MREAHNQMWTDTAGGVSRLGVVVNAADLPKYFTADLETGHIYRARAGGGYPAGQRCDHPHVRGYRFVTFRGKQIPAHRVIWAVAHGRWPEQQIDHINHERADNRLVNLREATPRQNGMNKTTGNRGTSRFKGVYWSAQKGKWVARIYPEGRVKHLGTYADEVAAAAAYDRAAVALYGEFASPNFGGNR